MQPSVLFVPLLLYFGAAVFYHVHLFTGSARTRQWATGATMAGVVTHAMVLMEAAWFGGRAPLGRPAETLSLLAWTTAVGQLIFEARADRRSAPGWAAMGSLSMPIAFVAVFGALLPSGQAAHAAPILANRLMEPHVFATILGFVSFALAFCCAVLYLVQSRLLKRKRRPALFRRFPPLEAMSISAHWMAALGFSMLTLGIVTGVIWATRAWTPGWYLDPKVITSVIAWLVYAVYLYASTVSGWRGRRTTYFLIAGFIVVLIAYYGVNLVAPSQHRF